MLSQSDIFTFNGTKRNLVVLYPIYLENVMLEFKFGNLLIALRK